MGMEEYDPKYIIDYFNTVTHTEVVHSWCKENEEIRKEKKSGTENRRYIRFRLFTCMIVF